MIGELKTQLYPELRPLLDLPTVEGWVKKFYSDGQVRYGVWFWYRGNEKYSVGISYWKEASDNKYQTWAFRQTDVRYPTLQEAIDRVQRLMPQVAFEMHWKDIAFVINKECWVKLIDRNGIGKGTITRLASKFGSLQILCEATIEDLEAVPGIGSDKAWLIASHLHSSVRYHELWSPSEEGWVDLYQVPKEVIDQCMRTRTYLTQTIRNKYQLTKKEIEKQGLVKEKPRVHTLS